MAMNQICRSMLWVLLIWVQTSQTKGETKVRLTDGPSRYVGNIEYSLDGGITWRKICGQHLTLNKVKVICRQLGFKGANKHITNSPFGGGQKNATTYFTCSGAEQTLTDCSINDGCAPGSTDKLGAAACYDERYIGCFKDNAHRVLPDSQTISNLTIEKCIKLCNGMNEKDYIYAGVEYSTECYCGDASAKYDRFGTLETDGCQHTCGGDTYSSCGGANGIAVFNLSVILTTETSTEVSSATADSTKSSAGRLTTERESSTTLLDSSILPITYSSSLVTKIEVESTLTSTAPPTPRETNNTALYAGAGGGGAIVVILIIIIITAFGRKRNAKEKAQAFDQPLTPMGPYNQVSDTPINKEGYSCYENKGAEKGHDYQNTNELNKREYVNLPEAMDNKEISYMNPENKSSLEQATREPSALYAMSDLSAKSTLSRPMTYTSPDKADGPSLLYAMPDRRAKTVYSRSGKPSLEEQDNFNDLYSTSTKNRLEPIGMETLGDDKDMYALPDKKRQDHVIQNGAEKRDVVQALYAMPDRSRGANDIDNTIMIENDIYSST